MITLLTGQNSYAIADAVRQKRREFKGDAETVDALELEPRQLPDLFMGASLFSNERLIVLRGASMNKSIWVELEKWIEHVPTETEIVLVDSAPDKRTKTYKLLQRHASITEHKVLTDNELTSWLQKTSKEQGVVLAPEVARYLVGYVGHDQWRLESELQKLQLSGKPITRELIQDITEPYPEATAFELLDSVFAQDADRVELLIDLLSAREDPYQFFGLLSSQATALLAIGAAGSRRPADIAHDMALHPFVISKLQPIARKLGRERVNTLIEKLAYCDTRIKTSGVNPWQQLRLTLLDISFQK